MDDVNLANDLQRMLGQFRQAAVRIAKGADFRHVLDAFGEFATEKALLADERAGSAAPDSASVDEILMILDELADTVNVLQMHFKEGITLGALQAELGEWYRDPPEPAELAFTRAYFNPARIDRAATFFVTALIDEFCDRYTPQTLVQGLSIDYRDVRTVTDRPW